MHASEKPRQLQKNPLEFVSKLVCQCTRAPVVQRIEQIRPKDKMVVQFRPGAPDLAPVRLL